MNELTIIPPQEMMRQATDVASVCQQIVTATALEIEGKKYVRVEGWQAIAVAHGCIASSRDVKRIDGGICATGEVRRMSDGVLLSTAEGFCSFDEKWSAEYAVRGMAQTRSISRACRSAFAHVVVLMNAGLQTTPAEEFPEGGFKDAPQQPRNEKPAQVSEPVIIKVISVEHSPAKGTYSECWFAEFGDGSKGYTRKKDMADDLELAKESGIECKIVFGKGKSGAKSLPIESMSQAAA